MKYLLISAACLLAACSTNETPTPDCNAAQTTYNAYCNQQSVWISRIHSAKDAKNWTAVDRYYDSLTVVQSKMKTYAETSGCNLILCD